MAHTEEEKIFKETACERRKRCWRLLIEKKKTGLGLKL